METTGAVPPRVQISLEASLCDNPAHGEASNIKIQVHQPRWSQVVGIGTCEFAPIPDGIRVHPATASALAKCQPCSEVAQFQLFIDGSAIATAAGWSVVVIAIDAHGGFQFVGCLCGQVCTNDALPDWCGASSATNIDAELQAMVVAQLVALSMKSGVPVVIRPDLKFSHDLAARRVGARKDDVLAAMLASLGSVMPPEVSVQEVRGHVGDPWNELADVLAKSAANQGLSCGSFPLHAVSPLVRNNIFREWMWWGLAPQQHKAAFPKEHSPGEWQVSHVRLLLQLSLWAPLNPGNRSFI